MYLSIIDPHIAGNLLASAGAVAVYLLVRPRWVASPDGSTLPRYRRLRLLAVTALTLALLAIWFAEVQILLWSLTAVVVAFVIATKELIQCATGALLRRAGASFRIGDQLTIDGVSGEVVAHGVLTTTIAETEGCAVARHRTGRRIVVPNSRLFAADLKVEAPSAAVGPARFHIVFDPSVSVVSAVSVLETTLKRYCEPFAESGAVTDAPAPLVTLATTDLGRVRLDILCFVPADEAVALEREVKLEFLEWLWGEAQARQIRPPAGRRYAAVNDARARVA